MAGPDLSIYSQFLRAPRSVADYDAERRRSQLDELALADAREVQAGKQRTRARQDQLQALMQGLPADVTDEQRVAALRGGAFFDQADALEKGIGERAKTRAQVDKDTADTKTKTYELQRKQYEHRLEGLRRFTQPEDARQWLADSVVAGVMGMKEAQGMIAKVPTDAAEFSTWRDNTIMSLMDAGKQAGFVMPDANAKLSAATSTANNAATNARVAAEGAANRAVTVRGQNLTDARARDLNVITKTDKAEARKAADTDKAVTKFSDTLQKEGIPDLETAVAGAEGEIAKYKPGEVPGVGPAKNVAPDWLMSKEGKGVRQALAQVRNIVLSARSGAAVTDQELRRLVEELGTGVGKTEDDLRNGLAAIRARVEAIKENAAAGVSDDVLKTYTERGGLRVTRGKGAAKPSPTGSGFRLIGTEG